MNHTRKTLGVVTLLALAAASAFADGGKTREQVRAELIEARRSGNIIGNGEAGGARLNELFPSQYASSPAQAAKTRSQVKQELAEARRDGSIGANGEGGSLALNELYPQRYPDQPQLASRSRAEVRAELAEARSLGEKDIGEDGLTPAERHPEQYAAARAKRSQDERLAARPSSPKR